MNDRLPKVLVISITVWRDDSPVRTLPELFSCWDRERIAQIYTRAGLPDNSVCDRYFRIDENAVMKSVFKRNVKTGVQVENCKGNISEAERKSLEKETSRYNRAHKKHSWFMTLCREAVWRFGKWKTEELDRFVEEFDPDVIFAPVYPFYYMERLQTYLIKKYKKPVVTFIADDNYTYKPCASNPLAYLHRFILRRYVRKMIPLCNEAFVMTPMAKREYDRLFGIDSKLLTRAVDFPQEEVKKETVNSPVKIVYAGKLVIGRDKVLAQVAQALANINKDKVQIELDIYSPDKPASSLADKFCVKGCRLLDAVPKDKLVRIQNEADVVLFAESLDKRYKNAARLSFSTKLTDYFSSGRCVLAIGSKDIAPVDYLISEDAAIVVTSYEDIEPALRRLADNPQLVLEYGLKSAQCGKKNHNIEKTEKVFKDTICNCKLK